MSVSSSQQKSYINSGDPAISTICAFVQQLPAKNGELASGISDSLPQLKVAVEELQRFGWTIMRSTVYRYTAELFFLQ